ncbi:MAG TPA: hypothetical protein VII92_02930, partial [Anaerolineae bacterium]
AGLNKRLGKSYVNLPFPDFAAWIRGKKTIASLRDAVDTALARAKIDSNVVADKMQINLNTLQSLGEDYSFLFADLPQIVGKDNDDFTALVKVRISEHAAAEAKRLEAEREKIRAEEEAKATRKAEQERAREEKRLMEESIQRRLAEEAQARIQPAAQPPISIAQGHPAQPAVAAVPTVGASGRFIYTERPSDQAIIHTIALSFSVDDATALEWLRAMFSRQAA